MIKHLSLHQLDDYIGCEIGVSDWIEVSQERIEQFADVTEDWQFIHIDQARARATPFGSTIAHGFLILSLLSKMAAKISIALENGEMGINFGFDKVRFVSPVVAGSRVRGRFVLNEVTLRDEHKVMLRYGVTVDIEGHNKPALVADWLTLQVLDSPQSA